MITAGKAQLKTDVPQVFNFCGLCLVEAAKDASRLPVVHKALHTVNEWVSVCRIGLGELVEASRLLFIVQTVLRQTLSTQQPDLPVRNPVARDCTDLFIEVCIRLSSWCARCCVQQCITERLETTIRYRCTMSAPE